MKPEDILEQQEKTGQIMPINLDDEEMGKCCSSPVGDGSSAFCRCLVKPVQPSSCCYGLVNDIARSISRQV